MDFEAQHPDRVRAGAIWGALTGFVVMGGLATGLGVFFDLPLWAAAGMGAFVAIWSGCGFGAMLGATVASMAPESRDVTAPEDRSGTAAAPTVGRTGTRVA